LVYTGSYVSCEDIQKFVAKGIEINTYRYFFRKELIE